eukprot:13353226-Alexandrium_andersonii.AAC.1
MPCATKGACFAKNKPRAHECPSAARRTSPRAPSHCNAQGRWPWPSRTQRSLQAGAGSGRG